jgi:hypothetical protein
MPIETERRVVFPRAGLAGPTPPEARPHPAGLVQAVRFFRVELLFSALSRCPKEGDIGITPPFVKNCTLSREPEVRDVRPIRGQDYIIEQLASVT